ncbi:hypothetical protein EV361DRAFT_870964 [Lentinula raphanica]|nr:hypothetical protein EV361DRAFT_870964 [Lentinula raphanica]
MLTVLERQYHISTDQIEERTGKDACILEECGQSVASSLHTHTDPDIDRGEFQQSVILNNRWRKMSSDGSDEAELSASKVASRGRAHNPRLLGAAKEVVTVVTVVKNLHCCSLLIVVGLFWLSVKILEDLHLCSSDAPQHFRGSDQYHRVFTYVEKRLATSTTTKRLHQWRSRLERNDIVRLPSHTISDKIMKNLWHANGDDPPQMRKTDGRTIRQPFPSFQWS